MAEQKLLHQKPPKFSRAHLDEILDLKVILVVGLAIRCGQRHQPERTLAQSFPYSSPALFSMTTAFVGIWLFSILDRSANAAKERAAFPAQQVRSETGYGASGASGH